MRVERCLFAHKDAFQFTPLNILVDYSFSKALAVCHFWPFPKVNTTMRNKRSKSIQDVEGSETYDPHERELAVDSPRN